MNLRRALLSGCSIALFVMLLGAALRGQTLMPCGNVTMRDLIISYAYAQTLRTPCSGAVAVVGPGDVVAGATSWWGLRAYNAVAAGAGPSTKPVVDVRGASTTTSCTVFLKGNNTSDLDLTTSGAGGVGNQCASGATTFCTVTNTTCTVSKLYDQVGTNHLLQATVASQPVFVPTGGPTSLPTITFTGNGAAGQFLSVASFSTTITQPNSTSHVINMTSFNISRDFFRSTSGRAILGYNQTGTDQYDPYAGTFIGFAAASSSYHAIQTVFNGASGAAMVDGTDNTSQNFGALDLVDSTDTVNLNDPPQGTAVPFKFEELGLWAIAFSSGQRASMNSNQRTYWGF